MLNIENNITEEELSKIENFKIKLFNLNPNVKNIICACTLIGTLTIPITAVFNSEINAASLKKEYKNNTYVNMDYFAYTLGELYYVELDDRIYICTANKEFDNTIIYRDANFQNQVIGTSENVDNVYSVLDIVVDAIKDGKDIDNYGYYVEEYRREYNAKIAEKEK